MAKWKKGAKAGTFVPAKAKAKVVKGAKVSKARLEAAVKAARAEQGHLPGLAPKRDGQIHAAALGYHEARKAAKNAGHLVKDKWAKLIEILRGKKVNKYRYDDVEVTLSSLDKLTVKIGAEEEDDEDGAEELAPHPQAAIPPEKFDDNLDPTEEEAAADEQEEVEEKEETPAQA